MDVTDIKQILSSKLPMADQDYKGPFDSNGYCSGEGVNNWYKNDRQRYTGHFCNDNLNGNGVYEWMDEKVRHVYEGRMYVNHLEGYGVASYPDSSYFRGLFRQNHRFGPGILSHPNGKQDVGLWNGINMVRICGKILDTDVPVLAKSTRAKAYLAKYKEVIPVKFHSISEDFATVILTELNASDKVMEKKEMLFNNSIRNSYSAFMNKIKLHGQYFEDEPQKIFALEKIVDGEFVSEYKKVEEIIAWNNEPITISLQKHTFLHGKYEETAFCDSSSILNGDREIFKPAGELELANLFLLFYCKQGKEKKISKLLLDHDLYPNVCDVNGNTGMHAAVAAQMILTIKVLISFGANVDVLNDEGLTPILICLLQYIAVCEEVYNYEVAFLPPLNEDNKSLQEETGYFWRDALCSQPQQFMRSFSASAFETEPYLLSTSCEHPTPPKIDKKGKVRKSTEDDVEQSKPIKKSLKSEQEIIMTPSLVMRKERLIRDTLKLLLAYGANPNFGNVPLPPLILSLFTKNLVIVSNLIESGADCNIRSAQHDGHLTPLHTLCSMKMNPDLSSLAELLLNNGALPNLRSNTEHWLEEKEILDPDNIYIDEGKTPLHILCMRYDYVIDPADYLGSLYDILFKNGADPNLFYLGHTCISLAVIRGNTIMIKNILSTFEIDPNQILGNNMGVALTVLVLKKYKNILLLPKCKEVYKMLDKYNANPFNKILDTGNAIEFCEEENSDPIVEGRKKQKKAKKNSKDPHRNVIKCLYTNAEVFLNRHIQAKVVDIIYKYKIECDIVDKIFDIMVSFITVPETLNFLQILLNHDILDYNMLGFYALVKYVDSKNSLKKGKKNKPKKKPKKRKKGEDGDWIIDTIEKMEKESQPFKKIYAPPPEIDEDEEKYIVCYNCYQSKEKTLILCPNCELVYFCSEKCNGSNMRKKTTRHKCKSLFYGSELKKMQKQSSKKKQTKLDAFKKTREKFFKNPDFDFELRYAFPEIEQYRQRKEKANEDMEIDKKGKRRSKSPQSKGKKRKGDVEGVKSKGKKKKR